MKVNISIDDVSPHPLSSIRVVDQCYRLINIFPDIKFSLFVPTAYWRTIKQGIQTQEPLLLSNFPEFTQFISKLPRKNFEICYHGYFHGIPGVSDNDEFQHLTYSKAVEKFRLMMTEVEKCGLLRMFQPIFRPPAWRMSSEAIRAARDVGIEILALSPKEYAKLTYGGEDENFKKVLYYNCNPPFDSLFVTDSLEIVYHACEWDKNYLSTELCDQLIEFLSKQSVEFSFIKEMVNDSKEDR